MVIYKYELELEDTFEIETPAMFNPVHIAVQDGKICLWAEVVPDSPKWKRTFFCRGTGQTVPIGADRIGTVALEDGYVFHFYWLPLHIIEG